MVAGFELGVVGKRRGWEGEPKNGNGRSDARGIADKPVVKRLWRPPAG